MKSLIIYCFILVTTSNLVAQVTSNDTIQQPKFPGNMYQWIKIHTVYPPQIKDTNLHGTVYVSFKIEKDSSISDIALVKGIQEGGALNEEAIHIVSRMPKWAPASKNGIPVESHYITVPVHFGIPDGHPGKPDTSYLREDDGTIFTFVQVKPQFKGDIYQWLGKHLKYPEKAQKANIEGTVYIQFIVEKDGSVSNIHVLRGVAALLDNEAVRVVSSMPKWIPGMQNNHAVRVNYMLPIHFTLVN